MHGDTTHYATAEVCLQVGKLDQVAKVAVPPELPVAVLLGGDLL